VKIISINVSKVRRLENSGRLLHTGIFKEPVAGRVRLGRTNLEGDAQADLENHGGIYKAVYAYPFEHYAYWMDQLQRTGFTFGQFGENLTVEGMTEDEVSIGDVFEVGSAKLQVTQPRTPCYKLGVKMGLADFPKAFLASGRIGFYLRVLEEGELGAGDILECTAREPGSMKVREISHLKYFEPENFAKAEKAVAIRALAPVWRESFKQRLAARFARRRTPAAPVETALY
jgi:MOSC domain-containing protein YiiM